MSVRCSLRRLRLAAGVLAVGVGAVFVLPVTGAVAAQHGRPGNSQTPVPVRNGSADNLGPYNPAQTIRLAIGLRVPHMAAEERFLRQIQDKHSPLFHHFLTAKAGIVYKLSLFQENTSAVKYSAGWTRQTLAGANGGSVDFATAAGKTATLSFTGFQVAWMSTQGPTRGSATVKLDAGTAQTINTHTSAPQTAEIVDVVTAAQGAHKVVVKTLGTAGHPRIDVDAFIVLSK